MGKAFSGRRPEDQPMYTRPTHLDFDKRRLFVPIASGSPTPHPSLMGRRPATYVVAASDAPASWRAQCDTLCTGTNDHLNIQEALDAGYDVLLSPGTFYIEVSLSLSSNNMLSGFGQLTVLTTTTADLDIVTATGGSGTEKTGIVVRDLCIDGDAGSVVNDCGIKWAYVDKSYIINCNILDCGENGISLTNCDWNEVSGNYLSGNDTESFYGVYLDLSCSNIIKDNRCTGNEYGILIYRSDYNAVQGNVCGSNAADGIVLWDSDDCNVTGNNCSNNSESGILVYGRRLSVFGNSCNSNGYNGIRLQTGVYDSTISGNACNSNTLQGIYGSCLYNVSVSQNTCNSNGEDGIQITVEKCIFSGNICCFNSYHGIELDGVADTNIIGNTAYGNSQDATNTYDDIRITNADDCLVSNNLCRAGNEANVPKYGLNISNAGCSNVKVLNNDLYDDGFGTAPYVDAGTGTIYVEPGIDDTPVDGETAQPISSNWAYDHENAADPHSGYALDTDLSNHVSAADPHTGYVKESEFTAANDVLVGTGVGTLAKKTATELLAILSGQAGAAFDWNGQQLQNMVFHTGATVPASPVDGQPFFHAPTGRNVLLVYDAGTASWINVQSFGTMTMYVDTANGTDAIDKGTGATTDAFATIQYAIDRIPGLVGGDVVIYVAAGSYAEGVTVRGKNFTGNYSIKIYGTLTAHATNAQESSVQGATTTRGSITDTGQFTGHTNDLLYSSNNDEYFIIETATDDTGTIAGYWAAAPSGNYTIYQWGTTVTAIAVANGQQNTYVYDMAFSNTSYALIAYPGSSAYFYRCKFYSSAGHAVMTQSITDFHECYFHVDSATRICMMASYGYGRFYGCKFDADYTSAYGVKLTANSVAYFYDVCVIDGTAAAGGEATAGLFIERLSFATMENKYHVIRDCDIGVNTANGGMVIYTTNLQYSGNTTDEQADGTETHSWSYIE